MSKRSIKHKYQPYPDGEECPCESGLLYGRCCKRKTFKFLLDERGRVHKRLKLHPRLKPALEEAAVEFRKVLGRSPGPKDPVVFNHHLTGEEDFWHHTRTIGRATDIPEQLIFAWRRSGFIVGKQLLLLETAESTFLRRQTKRDIRHVAKALGERLLVLITSDTLVKRVSIPPTIYSLFGLTIQADAVRASSPTTTDMS